MHELVLKIHSMLVHHEWSAGVLWEFRESHWGMRVPMGDVSPSTMVCFVKKFSSVPYKFSECHETEKKILLWILIRFLAQS